MGTSASQAQVILSRAQIKPHLTEYWIMSEFSPEFDERAAEVCGLYVDPPENVLVVSIDEKTGIQAKAPTKPDQPAAPGKPARREHEYKRNGTQCLFAGLIRRVSRGSGSGRSDCASSRASPTPRPRGPTYSEVVNS